VTAVTAAALVRTIYDPPPAQRSWWIADALPGGGATYYSLGRWALVEALRLHGVGPGDRVLLPALICRDVLAAVHLLGATADYYPVSPRLCAMSLDAAAPAKVVLAVNYFGFPQPLGAFREFCGRTGAALVEDNAHGLFSRDADGSPLGGRGDAGIFSFRKSIAVPDGAALVVGGGASPASPVRAIERAAIRYRAKQVARHLAGRVDPVRAIAVIGAIRRLRHSLNGGDRSSVDAETRMPLASSPSATITRPLAVADPRLESERRRALYEFSARALARVDAVPILPELPRHVVPWGFPLLVPPTHARAVTDCLARHGLPLIRWPDLPSTVAASAPDHYRNLMVVPFLW
jgi:hypothetical protein